MRWAGGRHNELRAAEDEAIASLQDDIRHTSPELMTASISGRSFSLRLTNPASLSSPGLAEVTARSFGDKRGHFAEAKHNRQQQPYMRIDELADEAGAPILYVSGANYAGRAGACITFPDQRWLRFLVRGTSPAIAIMTALDQAGNSVARYWIISKGFKRWQDSAEIIVRPGQELTDDLVLAIAISAPWLGSYFNHPG